MPKTYTPIARTTLTSAAANVTFSSISGSYTDLILTVNARTTSMTDTYDALQIQFNSDTASNYSDTAIYGDGSAVSSQRRTSQSASGIARLSPGTGPFLGMDATIINIQNYSNTTTYKTMLSRSNAMNEYYEVGALVGLWRSTAAINAIKLYPAVASGFAIGSTFTLYGILAA